MRTTAVGSSEVLVTALGFGGAGIGNLHHAVEEETALAAVEAAWAEGIRFFDTAPHYGLGLSERRLGAALTGRPRTDYAVSTKVGRLLEPNPAGADKLDDQGFQVTADTVRRFDYSADGVRRSVEASLARLGLDHVDIVLLHDPDDHWHQAVSEAYPALRAWRDQGVVGAIGVGMNQWQMPTRFVEETDIDVVMLAGRYTLLDNSGSKLLSLCASRGVSVLGAGVFNSGVLATDTPGTVYNYAPIPECLFNKAAAIAQVCTAHQVRLPQAAMAYVARHPAVVSVVVGVQDAAQTQANTELFAQSVPEALWDDLDARGLVPRWQLKD